MRAFTTLSGAMARKTQFCSLTSLRIAINLAVVKYNLGNVAGVSRCFVAITDLEAVSSRTMSAFSGLDVDRVDHSTWRNTDLHKRRRKHLALLRTIGSDRGENYNCSNGQEINHKV